MWAGEDKVRIQGYGNIDVQIQSPKGKQVLRLYDVAFCPDFACNLISLRLLHRQGYWWDNRPGFNCLRRAKDNTIVALMDDHYGQFVLEYIPENLSKTAFFTRRNKFNTWTERRAVYGDAWRWHLRLGHPGPLALEHFVNCSQGARIRGPTTVECDSCGRSKAKRQIRRQPRELYEGPGLHLAADFHSYELGHRGFTSQMLVTDRWSGFIWDYYLQNRTAKTIIAAFKHLFGVLERQYGIRPKVIEGDNEIFSQKHELRDFLEAQEHMRIEPSAPYTGPQNGAAERSGGVIKDKSRAMREGARLPAKLWPEISRAAVYLHNRTPRYTYNWKAPFDRFHTYLAFRDGVVVDHRKPQAAHLKVYGCKAYALTTETLKKTNRLQRLNPKAWIGYLVGYDSTNKFRVWNPVVNKVVSTRDVIFDEDSVFDGNLDHLRDDLLRINLDELKDLLDRVDESTIEIITEENQPSRPMDDESVIGGFDFNDNEPVDTETSEEDTTDSGGAEPMEVCNESNDPDTAKEDFIYPTPASSRSPPAALLAASIGDLHKPNHDSTASNEPIGPKFEVWKAAFNAGRLSQSIGTLNRKPIDKAKIQRLIQKPNGLQMLHRHDLPPEPTRHEHLTSHPLGNFFEQAEKDHIQGHEQMRTWLEISRLDPQVKEHKILDSMWVYVYKFDKHGRLLKCKSRLVVRGDQQAKNLAGETYAATLAGRSFRALIAIAARFDLELIQYDAVNAFVNASLDEDVFMKLPPGYRRAGKVLKLNKALFGLRRSPLLWHRELSQTLRSLGFQPVPHEPCCLTHNGIIVFFYVDDIVFAYNKRQETVTKGLIDQLLRRYKLTGGQELQWFLGIEVIRDRKNRRIWLSQSSYIDKIVNLADSNQPDQTPMSHDELLPYEHRAPPHIINRYQKKVGSLLYAAVTTRVDIAFATSRLARFLTNPGPQHHAAADRVLLYLKRYRNLGLQFGGGDDFVVASDASFADNTVDRKSSQAYAMKLFNGLIGWRANKQDTVTTSTTEAELLALSQAAKEGQYISRLLQELTIELNDPRIQIQCDNAQTIRLVNEEITRLRTKLRHVDIHNHWLRQEVSKGRINVTYTPSKDMIADGLTKTLSRESFDRFLNQVGLHDISEKLHERQISELQNELNIQKLLDEE